MDGFRLLAAVLCVSLTLPMMGCAHHRQSQSCACGCTQGGACSCSQQGSCDCGNVAASAPQCAPAAAPAATEPAAPEVAPPPPKVDAAELRQPNAMPVVETSKPLDTAPLMEQRESEAASDDIEFTRTPASSTSGPSTPSDPCSRPQTAQDAAGKPGSVQLPESSEDLPTPLTAEEDQIKLDAINLQRAIEAADLPEAAATDAPKPVMESAPQTFEPDSGARALEPTSGAPAAAAQPTTATDPYRYSYPGTPSSRNVGVARARPGVRINAARQTPQYNSDARNLGELYQPHYSNGMMNQFRYGW